MICDFMGGFRIVLNPHVIRIGSIIQQHTSPREPIIPKMMNTALLTYRGPVLGKMLGFCAVVEYPRCLVGCVAEAVELGARLRV